MSESVTCGGSGPSLLVVSPIFNSVFIVISPASKKLSVVEGDALRSVMVSFAACFFYLPTLLLEKGTCGVLK